MFSSRLSRPLTRPKVTDITSKAEIRGLPTSRDTAMRSLQSRYRSFMESNVTWPLRHYTLAQAGFYYVGPGDRVRCFSCRGELENWEPWDVPLTRHQRSFPDCPHVRRIEAQTPPVFAQSPIASASTDPRRSNWDMRDKGERISPTVPSSSNCPTAQEVIKDQAHRQAEPVTEGESDSSIPVARPLGDMSDEYSRLETYRGHRHHFPHNNQQHLAQAGFYYMGLGDWVRCFSCGGELGKWEYWRDPLTRHQRFFPDCPHVRELGEKARPLIVLHSGSDTSEVPSDSNRLCIWDEAPLFQIKQKERLSATVPGSSVTHGDKSDPPELQPGTRKKRKRKSDSHGETIPIKGITATEKLLEVEERDSGQVEERDSGQVEERDSGQLGKGAAGQVKEGASAHVKEGATCDQAAEMDSGAAEVEPKVQAEEPCDRPRGSTEERELCGKAPEVPQIHPQRIGTKYRLVVPREGLFRCSETRLQFRVESPADIEIEIGSWVEFLGPLHQYRYDIVGPLFNITVKSGRVSAVYLPHYVCLRGGDVDIRTFRVVHYKDDNMILESPTSVEPFYVVLENPTFSPVGVIKLQPSPNGCQQNIPTHGIVLLYSRYKTGYTLHLYLMPHDVSLKKAVHKKETGNGFYWIDKPPQTSTIHTEKIYVVRGPKDADIYQEELQLNVKSELYNYSEIYLEEIEDKIHLQLTCEGEDTLAWQTRLRAEDLKSQAQATQELLFCPVRKHEVEMSSSDSDSTPTALNTPVQEMEGECEAIKVESEEQEQGTCDWPSGCVMECELCGKISAAVQIRPKNHGNKYRLELPRGGLFHCSETGIQFRVKSAIVIEYELPSWEDYMKTIQQNVDIVGPLFNISILSEPGLVSEVHLPHYVCLKGENADNLEMKIAHYKDDNMILESPTRVEPYYAVLENPTFSPIVAGILKYLPNILARNIPIHGIVQLYCRYIDGYTIHLYLMPQDPSLKKEVHKMEIEENFYQVNKPPLTRTVYSTNKYAVKGPTAAEINPPEIEMRLDRMIVLENYSEIYLPAIEDSVSLHLISSTESEPTNKSEDNFVWKTTLRKEDLRATKQAVCDTEHFIDRHRATLIRRTSHIDPILDDLLQEEILSQEQYEAVRQEGTSQENMRKLYECIISWGEPEKETLYQSLKKHKGPLIRDIKKNEKK